MLKNPCNSTKFYSYTHDCILHLMCLSAKGWLATLRSLWSLRASLFQHICLQHTNKFYATDGLIEFLKPGVVKFIWIATMKDKVVEEIKKMAINNRLPCPIAREIAEKLSVSYKEVGRAADELNIKITNCELGCF